MHIPVLLNETISALAVRPGGRYIDGTVDGGGHAAAILEHSSPGGQLLGIDADPEAIDVVRVSLKAYGQSVLLVNDNFANLEDICTRYDFFPVHGILLDLGLSSLQLDNGGRGFSFQRDAPLDMRLSPSQKETAADIVNTFPEPELAHLIRTYSEEIRSRQIARNIVAERPIKTSRHLAKVIEQATGGRRGRIHPATKTFQALRIAVNHELEHLEAVLHQALNFLGIEGRLVVISYHSLEDRIVKRFMQREARDCICPPNTPACVCGHKASLRLVTRRVITPSPAEVESNPRSRSARLRAVERIITQDRQHDLVESLCFSAGIKAGGWRRPALVDRLRRTFVTLQVNYSLDKGRFSM